MFVSWDAVKEKAVGFYGLLLLLEAAMLGVFAARDIILFYVFFEFTLVPLFFLIGIWGHDDRRRAAVKFFIYTFAGSVLALGCWQSSFGMHRTLAFSPSTLPR